MEPPRTISVSQVNAYLGCPLKYRFQYVDKIPRPWRVAAMAFGLKRAGFPGGSNP